MSACQQQLWITPTVLPAKEHTVRTIAQDCEFNMASIAGILGDVFMGYCRWMATLYRPIGLFELRLVALQEFKRFPPRLPEQPIFYPVLNLEYATQIATRWNLDDPNSGFSGFVTQFDVSDRVVATYQTQTVGGAVHQELWVPADCQRAFEDAFQGPIGILAGWVGARFGEAVPTCSVPAGRLSSGSLHELLTIITTTPILGGPQTEPSTL